VVPTAVECVTRGVSQIATACEVSARSEASSAVGVGVIAGRSKSTEGIFVVAESVAIRTTGGRLREDVRAVSGSLAGGLSDT